MSSLRLRLNARIFQKLYCLLILFQIGLFSWLSRLSLSWNLIILVHIEVLVRNEHGFRFLMSGLYLLIIGIFINNFMLD